LFPPQKKRRYHSLCISHSLLGAIAATTVAGQIFSFQTFSIFLNTKHKRKLFMRKAFLLFLIAVPTITAIILLTSTKVNANIPRSFYGTVTYEGNGIPNTGVTATNTATQQQYQTLANIDGDYSFGNNLPAGTYNLRAQADASGGGYYIGTQYNKVYCPDEICEPILVNVSTRWVADPN
jgi:hypothetical protein